MVVFRAYSWLCNQESLLEVIRGFEPEIAACKDINYVRTHLYLGAVWGAILTQCEYRVTSQPGTVRLDWHKM